MLKYLNALVFKVHHLLRSLFGMASTPLFSNKTVAGDILVSGEDSIEIQLGRGTPKCIMVFFADDVVSVPCNPEYFDYLEYYLVQNLSTHNWHSKKSLIISWHVNGSRRISWNVSY